MMKLAFSGHFRIEVRDAETHRIKTVREFDNLITNNGLNAYGARRGWPLAACYIGRGTNAPSVDDTSLGQPAGEALCERNYQTIAPVAPDYVSGVVISYRFNAGTVVGNFSEVGIGDAGSNVLWSRALILDQQGNPSTISVQENEYLDVYYTLYLHPPITETKAFVVDINGVSHNVSARLAKASENGIAVGDHPYRVYFDVGRLSSVNTDSTSLGSITETVNGVQTDTSSGGYPYRPTGSINSYVENSFKCSTTFHFGLANDNYQNGISGLEFKTVDSYAGFLMYFQYLINPPIMKTNRQELDLTFEYSWGRYDG